MSTMRQVTFWTVVFLMLETGYGRYITMTIPNQVSAGSDPTNPLMTIECRSSSLQGNDEVVSITLSRLVSSSFQEETVAFVNYDRISGGSLTTWGPSSIGSRSPTSTNEGSVDSADNSYLRVGVKALTCADSGMYKCSIIYMIGGISNPDSTNQNITVTYNTPGCTEVKLVSDRFAVGVVTGLSVGIVGTSLLALVISLILYLPRRGNDIDSDQRMYWLVCCGKRSGGSGAEQRAVNTETDNISINDYQGLGPRPPPPPPNVYDQLRTESYNQGVAGESDRDYVEPISALVPSDTGGCYESVRPQLQA